MRRTGPRAVDGTTVLMERHGVKAWEERRAAENQTSVSGHRPNGTSIERSTWSPATKAHEPAGFGAGAADAPALGVEAPAPVGAVRGAAVGVEPEVTGLGRYGA